MKFLFIIVCSLLIISCKQDSKLSQFAGNPALQDLHSKYTNDPTPATASALIKGILDSAKGETDPGKRKEVMNFGYEIAKEQKITSRQATFLFPIIKDSYGEPGQAQRLFDLAGLMTKMKKSAAANTLYMSIVDNHKDFAQMDQVKSNIPDSLTTVDAYLLDLGERLFVDVDNTGINRNAAMKYVDASEAFALGYPNSPKTAETLFKSAEVAKSIRTFAKSLSLYDWIIDKYPDYEKAPTALFLKGFIIENNVGDDKKAREIYDLFLKKYPDNDLADDVEFLIDNLGKSDEEILQMIEDKRREKEAANSN